MTIWRGLDVSEHICNVIAMRMSDIVNRKIQIVVVDAKISRDKYIVR